MSSVSSKYLAICAVSVLVSMTTGCSSNGEAKTADASVRGDSGYTVKFAHAKGHDASAGMAHVSFLATQQKKAVTVLDRVVWNAQKQQGKMYRYGGQTPATSFDCSGLTKYAFGQGAGVALPRTAAEQYSAAVKVPTAQASKGDLVFFHTHGSRVSHVGIYLGNGKFVHAPRTGRAITTEALSGYWSAHLIGFGRIPGACKPVYS